MSARIIKLAAIATLPLVLPFDDRRARLSTTLAEKASSPDDSGSSSDYAS